MRNKLFPFILIFFVWVVFSYPFLLNGKAAFPSDYQVNFFSPWNTYREFVGPVKNNAQPDIITQIYPWRYFDISELKEGRLALWNPYSFAGTPHLANYQSAVLFPLNILFLLPFEFIDVWSFLVILQPLLAGLFMYFLMREYKVSQWGSVLSSFSFMFCGFITTWMGYATLGFAILVLPLAIFSIEKYLDSKNHIWSFLLSLIILFSYLSGHFQTSIYMTLVVISYLIYSFILIRKRGAVIDLFFFTICGLLLAMPQILPSIELYSLSVRSILFQKVEAIPWGYLPTLISPDFYGNPVTRNDWFGHYAEWNGFAGSVTLIFAIFAILFKRNLRTYFYITIAAISLLLAYNTPILSLLIGLKVPVLSTSSASRIIVLLSFSIAVLGGIGFDGVLSLAGKDKKKLGVWVGVVLLMVGIAFAIPFAQILPHEKAVVALKNSMLPLGIICLILSTVCLSFILRGKKYVLTLTIIVLLLSGFEMYRFAAKWQSFEPKNLVFRQVPVVGFYAMQNHTDRASGLSGGEDAVYYQMPILGGYDPLYKKEYGKFIQYIATGKELEPDRSTVSFPLDGKYTPFAINFLGVKFIVHKFSDGNLPWAFPFSKYPLEQFTKVYSDPSYIVYKNNQSFERAYIVSNVKKVEKEKELELMMRSNLKNEAFVEEDIERIDNNSSGSAEILVNNSNRVVIGINTTGKSFLVLTDNYYPGWKVYVNGIRQKIYKANYSFRGVTVPKGESTVTFTFFPYSFLLGTYLFLIGFLGITASIILRFLKSK